MTFFLAIAVLAVLVVLLAGLNRRIRELEDAAESRAQEATQFALDAKALRERVDRLEAGLVSEAGASSQPARPERAAASSRAEPAREPLVAPLPKPVMASEKTAPEVRDVPPITAPAARVRPPRSAETRPTLPSPFARQVERFRKQFQREEWEAVVGGNWLNKLGVLVLVTGISLFLGYSLTQLGPVGRVALGVGASVALLVIGVVFERRPGYAMFGRGLIGGGWAAGYFTTYAMHGLEAAKVIDNPVTATLALAAVAGGMIVHSLRYRSQVVTGLAYFVGFATLAISPATTFSVAATVPLAASLLWVVMRSSWSTMAVGGLMTTYGTYLFTTAATTDVSMDAFVRGQMVLGIYWLLFEAFDILSARRSHQHDPVLLSLNACAFLGVSYLQWLSFTPDTLHVFFTIAAAAYLLSTMARALLLRKALPSDAAGALPTRDLSYRWSVTAAVALTAAAIPLRFSGQQINVAFLLVGEMLFLCGLRFGDPYLRWLAAFALAVPALKPVIFDVNVAGDIAVWSWMVRAWIPSAVLTAAVFYLNRTKLAVHEILLPEGGYRVVASGLLMLAVGFEAPTAYQGACLLVLAAALLEVGLWRRLLEFRAHAYVIGAIALFSMLVRGADALRLDHWFPAVLHASLAYALLLRVALARRAQLADPEGRLLFAVSSWFGTVFAVILVAQLTPDRYFGAAWLVLAAALFEASLRMRAIDFRYQAYAVGCLALAQLFVIDAFPVTVDADLLLTSIGTASVMLWGGFARALRLTGDTVPDAERGFLRDATAGLATVLMAILCWQLLPTPIVAMGWAVLAVTLLDAGTRLGVPSLRVYGHLAMGLMLGRLLVANLTSAGTTFGVTHRVLTILPATALVYLVSAATRGRSEMPDAHAWERRLSRAYLWAGALLAVLLIGFELGRTASVAGWAVMSVALLALGLRQHQHDLRLQGYAVGALTFVRSWVTSFYVPDSLASSQDRLVLAAIVIVNFHVAQYLLTRGASAVSSGDAGRDDAPRAGFDRHASVFATTAAVLLTQTLYYELSAGLLTVGWGVQGAILLGAGFMARNRTLRRLGLLLLAVCTVKVFASSFRTLDALSRILSFIVLGVLMLVTSWTYARYRERLRQYI